MIQKFRLKSGRTPLGTSEDILATPMTIFVGPNNSGKSKALAEINLFCENGNQGVNRLLLADIAFEAMAPSTIDAEIARLRASPPNLNPLSFGSIYLESRGVGSTSSERILRDSMLNPPTNLNAFCQGYLRLRTLLLSGGNRISLINDQPAGDLQKPPKSSLQILFRDDERRMEVRRIVYEALSVHFIIDPTMLGQLRIRLSNRPPVNSLEERGIHKEAVDFHSGAEHIYEASDGVKAFLGILIEVIGGDPSVFLIDEPEAFLHPSLAAKLGYELSRAANLANKRVFASTHSSAFLMGCIQSGAPVTIVRLTYRGRLATARVLPSNEVLELMRHPLLRSTGVLNGLFYEFIIVTESDADRAFYQEINERLLAFQPERAIPNCLFINAQNWQTVQTILGPLRKLGIPAAGIVDIDVIKRGGKEFTNLLNSASVPPASQSALSAMRAAVKETMEKTGRDMKREGGVGILPLTQREDAENLLAQLAAYGIFVVAGGELESWLQPLGATGHGPNWLIKIFERMGESPDAPTYVRPQEGDVWKFMTEIRNWLVDPKRRGIPE